MKITNIELQKNRKRYNIYIDDEVAFGISDELRYKFGLHIDDNIEQDFIEDILKSEEQMKAINYALKLLSYNRKTEKGMYDSLKRKGYDESIIEIAIDSLKDKKYIDDIDYAKAFINDKRNINNYGSNRIKYDLLKKGISKEIIGSTLNIDSDEEYNSAYELAVKKLKTYKGQEKHVVYRKLGGFLQRKGYSYEIISKILEDILGNWWYKMYYVYILKCNDNTLYTGYTNSIEKRIMTHNSGKGSKYTRGRLPVTLCYYEEYDNKVDACKREYQIKQLKKEKKLELIKGE